MRDFTALKRLIIVINKVDYFMDFVYCNSGVAIDNCGPLYIFLSFALYQRHFHSHSLDISV